MKKLVLTFLFLPSFLAPTPQGSLTLFLDQAQDSFAPRSTAQLTCGLTVFSLAIGTFGASITELIDRIGEKIGRLPTAPHALEQSNTLLSSPAFWLALSMGAWAFFLCLRSSSLKTRQCAFELMHTVDTWDAQLACLLENKKLTLETSIKALNTLDTIFSLTMQIAKHSKTTSRRLTLQVQQELLTLKVLICQLPRHQSPELLQAIETQSQQIFSYRVYDGPPKKNHPVQGVCYEK